MYLEPTSEFTSRNSTLSHALGANELKDNEDRHKSRFPSPTNHKIGEM